MYKTKSGFTLVELLIVIVVIAILAAITIVAYNGVQSKARDSRRVSEIQVLQKALAMYHIDNGGYPTCSNTTYQNGGTRGACASDNAQFVASLSPYISTVPKDPVAGNSYRYMFGSKQVSDVTYVASADDNYILVAAMDSKGGPYVTQLGATTKLNYMVGSNY